MLNKVLNLGKDINIHNVNNKLNFYDFSFIQKEKVIYLNGRYIIFPNHILFSLNTKDNLNIINENVKKINPIIQEYKFDEMKIQEFYKYFLLLENTDILKKKEQYNNIFKDIKINKIRGNVFSFSYLGNNYKLFIVSVLLNNIDLFFKFNLPHIKIFDYNLYHPLIFLKETLLYFYEKNKNIFLNEEIKIKNYIKSIGINLDNIIINLKEDEYFLNKLKKISKQDLFYKYFLLNLKEIGLLGKIWGDIIVVGLDKGEKIEIIKPQFVNGKLFFEGTGKEYVYINLLNYINKFGNASYMHTLFLNEKNIENIEFYDYELLKKINDFILFNP